MARPRRSTEEEFYDVFSSWAVDDQAIALRVMEQIHRIAKKKPVAVPVVGSQPTVEAVRERIHQDQQSLTGLPDEDQNQ